ncbi:MAG TPA: hypothetical protein VMQ62_12095, partial [Dongiaceae bacterium]|nr:hypothetical protein [Dongiaceae bacterium]
LRDAGVEFLDGALANPALRVQHLQAMLRSRSINAELIRRIAKSPIWTKFNRVRRAIVLHPRTPRPLAMNLLPTLRWADLLQVSGTPALAVGLRSGALTILGLRLPELSLGEKITLARSAPPPLLGLLLRESSVEVVRAALENRHAQPDEVAPLVDEAETAPGILRAIAESPRFAGRDDLRLALAAHPRTPAPVALRLLGRMEPPELARLLADAALPVLIRVAATRRLAEGPAAIRRSNR